MNRTDEDGSDFHSRPVGLGARIKSTLYASASIPVVSRRGGVKASPSTSIAFASGYASRSHYFWAGGGTSRCERQMLNPQCRFSIQYSAFSIQHSAFGIRHSAFSIRHSAFGIRHSALTGRLYAFSSLLQLDVPQP
jgi:hypothetical protein